MKTFIIHNLLTAICILICLSFAIAQNQSMLMPVPGVNNSVNNDGCKALNFSDPGSPAISSLPKWDSYRFNNPLLPVNPHDESHLEDAIPSMNEYYLGQHPAFAQSLVHDPYGNLLFFIVDNNIYNRHGVAFPKKTFPEDAPGPGYAYLHDGAPDHS